MKKNSDLHRRPPTGYVVGTKAYVSTQNLRMGKRYCRKLGPKYIGPFTITRIIKDGCAIELDLPSTLQIHNVFHPSLLKLADPNDSQDP